MNHTFYTAFDLSSNTRDVFDFFSDAANLGKITPPELNFHIRSPAPIIIKQGTQIDYRLKLWGIPFGWRTEITHWEPAVKFVDEQIQGPYHTWIHTHRFDEKDGMTRVSDEVRYRLPFWPAGEIVYPIIHAQIRRIFAYRETIIKEIFSASNISRNERETTGK
ncbi:MAG: SRPBCC family protein [SAR324 cluster bacterium]|nr:SRPBCC family protein [SAR324 cluster bacterium]